MSCCYTRFVQKNIVCIIVYLCCCRGSLAFNSYYPNSSVYDMDCFFIFLYIYYSRLRHRYKSNFNRKKKFNLISGSIMALIKSEPTDFFYCWPGYTVLYTVLYVIYDCVNVSEHDFSKSREFLSIHIILYYTSYIMHEKMVYKNNRELVGILCDWVVLTILTFLL